MTAQSSLPIRVNDQEPGHMSGMIAGASRAFHNLPQTRGQRLLTSLAILFSLAVLVVTFGSVARDIDYREMIRVLRRLPPPTIALSLCTTAVSFAALVGRDASALRYVGARVSLPALLLAGFCGSALGNAVGFGVLTAAAVRYRIYGAIGVKADDIARVLGFILVGFAVGLLGVGGLSGLLEAEPVGMLLGWSPLFVRTVSLLALTGVAYLLVVGMPSRIRLGGVAVVRPNRGLLATQLALTSIRLAGAAAALWVFLPSSSINFVTFAAIFSAATALAAVTHIPAGVGVFEIVVLWAFRGRASSESVAAALVAYRFVYYLLPLVASAIAFAYFEVAEAVGVRERPRDERLARAAARLSPMFMSVLAFATGAMLLVSGATPTFSSRLAELSVHVPLWALEASHFLGSVIGVVFLFVARGLLGRRDGAWKLALALSALSLVFSILKGLAFGEAAFLLLFTVLLLATRRQFYRPTSMFDQPFTWGWLAAVAGIVAASFGILFLAFQDLHTGPRGVWWQFEFDAQAPRALRALLGASILTVVLALRELLRAPVGLASKPTAAELEKARSIIETQQRGDATLALMADKSLLFSESGRTFLMFGKRGRSWIALFEPVGPRDEWPELIGRFIEMSRAHGGRTAFYQIRPESLPVYLDAGFSVVKLGEEAVVPLAEFSLKGGSASHLRYALKRGGRDGLEFEFLTPEGALPHMQDLAEISAKWVDSQRGDEKGFSVAAFEPGYVSKQYVGLLREYGSPVAFVSVMATRLGGEATVGLMRCSGSRCPVAMEYLFTNLILAMKERGFRSFSLGAAPLAGVHPAPLPSRWHRLASLIWKHGDRLYNFQGLRTFKGKFNPAWEPRYFAASGSFGPFVALADAAVLIGAGFMPAASERDDA
jgi:phosphatidylglycerol lysyltransferase